MMTTLVGQFIGAGAAFYLGGLLAAMFGPSAAGWQKTVGALSLPPLVLALALSVFVRDPGRAISQGNRPGLGRTVAIFRQHGRAILAILGGKIAILLVLTSLMIWGGPTLARTYHIMPQAVGAIMGLAIPAGGIAGTIAGGLLADFFQRQGGPRRTMTVLIFGSLIFMPLSGFAFLHAPVAAAAVMAILLGVLTALATMTSTLLIVAIPSEIRGVAIGLLTGIASFLSVGLAPLMVSTVAEWSEFTADLATAMALVTAACMAIAAIVYASGRSAMPGVQVPR